LVTKKPCILVAKNDLLVAPDPLEAILHDMEQVHYTGPYRLDMLPFLPRVSQEAARRFAQLPAPKALAMKALPPRYIDATGSTVAEAERKALLDCNQIAGTPCVLYAINNQVVLPQGKTAADP
jgi:hypothetical protein